MAKYKSMYSDRQVTEAQYLGELVAFNRAKHLKIELPLKFWRSPLWHGYYLVQIKEINALLKEYDHAFLVKFIRENRIWSLKPDWVKDKIRTEYANKPVTKFQEIETADDPTFRNKKDIDLDHLDGKDKESS